jgi:glycosyltransferase involved in cell wall biosynthesis
VSAPHARGLRRITVDLTPLLPGGQNGGAGLVAISLVRELARIAPSVEFTLLTSDVTDADLGCLDRPNIRRVCVIRQPDMTQSRVAAHDHLRRMGKAVLDRVLPSAARVRVKNTYWSAIKHRDRSRTARRLRSDLTFCPFTAPYFHDDATPLVAIVYDLQYQAYPEFFEEDQRRYRRQHVLDACKQAARVVCISEHVRQTLLASVAVPPERVVTVHLGLLQESTGLPPQAVEALLARLRVRKGRFLLYPANFWPHKNHRALIAAHHQFRQDHPDSDLMVVCTGAPSEAMRDVAAYAAALSPGSFSFAGYVSDAELVSLLQASAALIYPSLYEGFGMPILEAMAIGKPVLCSNVASLPEVAGDAAVLFDPNRVDEIAAAIDSIEYRPEYVAAIARRGLARAGQFGTAQDMAQRYLALFDEVLAPEVK